MNYKIYQKITYLCMALGYICLVLKISVIFENFLGSIFYLIAAITSRIYYTKKVNILCNTKEANEEIKKKINQNIGASFVAPLLLAVPAIIMLICGGSK